MQIIIAELLVVNRFITIRSKLYLILFFIFFRESLCKMGFALDPGMKVKYIDKNLTEACISCIKCVNYNVLTLGFTVK